MEQIVDLSVIVDVTVIHCRKTRFLKWQTHTCIKLRNNLLQVIISPMRECVCSLGNQPRQAVEQTIALQ